MLYPDRSSTMCYVVIFFTVLCNGCGHELKEQVSPPLAFHTGVDAKDILTRWSHITGTSEREALDRASNVFVHETGNFNGTSLYWSVQCASLDDCWELATDKRGPNKEDFQVFALPQLS